MLCWLLSKELKLDMDDDIYGNFSLTALSYYYCMDMEVALLKGDAASDFVNPNMAEGAAGKTLEEYFEISNVGGKENVRMALLFFSSHSSRGLEWLSQSRSFGIVHCSL